MDEGKPHSPVAHQRQPDEEAVVRDPAAAAVDVLEEATQEEAPMQTQEVVMAAAEDGADRHDLIDDAPTENNEAIAHALYMEELMQMEDWELRGFEEPGPADAFAAGAEGPAVQAASEGFRAMPHVFGGAAAQANAYNHHGMPLGNGESITIRREPRNGAQAMARRKDAVISARQAVLAGASALGILAGMEEEGADDDGWYESVVHDAQMTEAMEDPGLYGIPFQQQLPRSESPREEEPYYHGPIDEDRGEFTLQDFTKRWGLHPSELDPDEPGPSTNTPARVPPLADDDVSKFNCGICMETLPVLDLFHGMQCDHRFCVECMATYIEGRIHSGEVPIPCPDPGCKDGGANGALHPEECKKSIDFAAFGSWGDRLTERAIPPNRRAYCPNRQCGVMLKTTGGKTPAMAFCPVCSHAMCATCGLDWSADGSGQHDCAGGPEAALVKKLATERRWKQCPKCKMLVERTMGCRVMKCRCLFIFCYDCGRPMPRGQEAGGETCQCIDRAVLQAHGFL